MLVLYKAKSYDLPLHSAIIANDIAESLALGFHMQAKQVVKYHCRIKLVPSDMALAPINRGGWHDKGIHIR